ncbi:MAG: lysoplasmalogenase family protein [Rhodothermales bacterium]|nr:lysoplasmalogenase family protein [Rhodothermales bacterium]
MVTPVLLAIGVVACGLLLIAEYRRQTGGIMFWKMVAASVYLALAAPGVETAYGRLLMTALALSWIGDLLLLFDRKPAFFLGGLGGFFLAHIGFTVAMYAYGWDLVVFVGIYLFLGVLAHVWIWRGWLTHHVAGGMRVAVQLYLVAILVMVAAAISVSWQHQAPVFAVAALLFAVSDVAVARQQFVEATFENKIWGLPLYFSAQYLFAHTVGGP